MGDRQIRRAKRPAAHFFDLDEIDVILDAAWHLAKADRTAFANALRVEVALFTGLRAAELHNLRPSDVRPDGTLHVRMGKGSKPRVAAFVNGLEESPTLEVLRRYVAGKPSESLIWPSSYAAWAHWIVRRLGPQSGLQAEIECLNGSRRSIRYRVHAHAFRAAFVLICRRYPRKIGREPLSWETICQLGGWESVDTIRRHYYYADLDESLIELRRAIPRNQIPLAPRPRVDWGTGEI